VILASLVLIEDLDREGVSDLGWVKDEVLVPHWVVVVPNNTTDLSLRFEDVGKPLELHKNIRIGGACEISTKETSSFDHSELEFYWSRCRFL